MGEVVKVVAKASEIGERKVIVEMQMFAKDELRAKARMVAVAIKDNM